jgi:transposase-like protein
MEEMEEAVKLVREEGMSISAAAKAAGVPRTTLTDRLGKMEVPTLGRPQELPKAAERAIVKCLIMCAEYQYPMNKKDVQLMVQAYCLENGVETRWKESKPGKDWIINFQKRWSSEVKLRKPRHIKRSRAQVSPETIRQFFEHLRPNVEGVRPAHFFNYDETNLKDDPGTGTVA